MDGDIGKDGPTTVAAAAPPLFLPAPRSGCRRGSDGFGVDEATAARTTTAARTGQRWGGHSSPPLTSQIRPLRGEGRAVAAAVLTTKFGNLSIGDEDQIEEESKTETVVKTEQESAAIQIGYDKIGRV
uniref:Uncharacterized protein n=1 Tax=Oryza sativa subsp. japonica TaxID=39947 RepID=Q2QWG0_ORYSJ|nr:hypothetical protein LOC_Os12g09470 [Oryza sativa Japonica Group]